MKRGEVWWAELPPPTGRRPVVLLSRDEAYEVRALVIIAPVIIIHEKSFDYSFAGLN